MRRSSEFFGTDVAVREFGAFVLSVTDYGEGAIGWHGHARSYLTYVVQGDYCERLHGSTRDCSRHCLIPHVAGEVHRDDFRTAARLINIQPDPQWLERWAVAIDASRRIVSSEHAVTMARIRSELRRDDAFSPMAIEGLLHELMAALMRTQREDPAPRWLLEVRDEIHDRFRETLTLATLASAANVHPVHLARSFRRHFGSTVGALIRHRRVEYAKERIRAGAPLSEIAGDAGFADQSHFTRTFRSITGMTPAEFRRADRVPER